MSSLNVPYSVKKLKNLTTPNSDNLGKSYGCLNIGLLAMKRVELLLILYTTFVVCCDLFEMCC